MSFANEDLTFDILKIFSDAQKFRFSATSDAITIAFDSNWHGVHEYEARVRPYDEKSIGRVHKQRAKEKEWRLSKCEQKFCEICFSALKLGTTAKICSKTCKNQKLAAKMRERRKCNISS